MALGSPLGTAQTNSLQTGRTRTPLSRFLSRYFRFNFLPFSFHSSCSPHRHNSRQAGAHVLAQDSRGLFAMALFTGATHRSQTAPPAREKCYLHVDIFDQSRHCIARKTYLASTTSFTRVSKTKSPRTQLAEYYGCNLHFSRSLCSRDCETVLKKT